MLPPVLPLSPPPVLPPVLPLSPQPVLPPVLPLSPLPVLPPVLPLSPPPVLPPVLPLSPLLVLPPVPSPELLPPAPDPPPAFSPAPFSPPLGFSPSPAVPSSLKATTSSVSVSVTTSSPTPSSPSALSGMNVVSNMLTAHISASNLFFPILIVLPAHAARVKFLRALRRTYPTFQALPPRFRTAGFDCPFAFWYRPEPPSHPAALRVQAVVQAKLRPRPEQPVLL